MSSAPRPQPTFQPNFQNILFTTDFSPCSLSALPYARAIAEQYGSTIHVVNVVPVQALVVGEYGVLLPELDAANEAGARKSMDRLVATKAFEGLLYTQTVETGVVWDEVAKLADSLNADLIVMGTHGQRGLKHLMLGSVAEQVFRHATCPVLTVGPEVRDDGLTDAKPRTILYATDFSPSSEYAFHFAASLARKYNATLVLLHAVSLNEANLDRCDELVSQAKERLSQLMLSEADVNHSAIVDCKPAAELILEVSRGASAVLIVIGAHHGSPVSNHFPWAVAHQVVCNATCPVLTVRT